LSDDWYSVTF